MSTLPWLGSPDWTDGVTETLEWKTNVLQSPTGAEQRVARRLTPRRTFELTTVSTGAERGAFENMVARAGAVEWAMPLWADVAQLRTSFTAGTRTITFETDGRELVAGADLLLQSGPGWLASWEIVTIGNIGSGWITLSAPLKQDWSMGTLVYPLRPAFLTDPPPFRRRGAFISAQVRFQIAARNGLAAAMPATRYRSRPVLEHEPDYREDLSAEFQRLMSSLDNGSGLPHRTDTAGRPFKAAQHVWTAAGRTEQRALRAFFYWMRGRQRAVWVSGDPGELVPVSSLTGNWIDVAWCGLTETSADGMLPGRQDVVIWLANGTRIYRRITGVSRQAGADRLRLDGVAVVVPLSNITGMAFLTLSRLNDDAVSWEHITDSDGLASVSVVFRGVKE